jgi:hypothetical protein
MREQKSLISACFDAIIYGATLFARKFQLFFTRRISQL